MLRIERYGFLEIEDKRRCGLPGQTIYEIDSHITKPGLPCDTDGFDRFLIRMNSSQKLQLTLLERLYTDVDPIHPDFSVGLQAMTVYSTGIHFKGDLGVRLYGKTTVYGID